MFVRDVLLCNIAFVVVILTQTTDAVPGLRFTSVLDMEALAQQEKHLLDSLRHYINNQREKLSFLNARLEELTNVWSPMQTAEKLISDPISAFSLVRRLTREWPLILNFMMENSDTKDKLYRLPEEDCMQSAIRALTRLQKVYSLNTAQLAQETWDSPHLTALDCFEIGKFLFQNQEYNFAASWFNESLKKHSKKDISVEKDKILLYLFHSSLHGGRKNGNTPDDDTNALNRLTSQYPRYTLDEEAAHLFRQTHSSRPEKVNDEQEYHSAEDEIIFSRTCLGIGVRPSSDLRCYYIHYNNPRLVIAPFKMEEQNLYPPILMFYDVISDQEINNMKATFREVRQPCATDYSNGSKSVVSNYRTCDVGWVLDNDTATTARLSQRIGDITNLATSSSEYHQVASYGLGGEFQLHHDLPFYENIAINGTRDRFATFMIYLSDVESGGCTAFPRVNVTVEPAKGSAVFWFNLNHKSEGLDDMLHGGCPILRGSKWVLNKWIHEDGQTSDIFCPVDDIFPKKRYYLNHVK